MSFLGLLRTTGSSRRMTLHAPMLAQDFRDGSLLGSRGGGAAFDHALRRIETHVLAF